MNTCAIPFVDLVAPHAELEPELTSVFLQVLRSAAFIGGPLVEAFEQAFAGFCDASYAVAVSSGTDALRFAIMTCGVQPGDVVLTVPHTFIATTEAISQAGAVPEFVDIDEKTYNLSPQKLKHFIEHECTLNRNGALISRRTGRRIAAIVPVHIYGQMADMDPILDLADQYGLTVIEDACQAHGAQYFSKRQTRWMTAGTMGHAAAFSFYPGKNLGACGEAGAVTTNDAGVAERIKTLRDHGQVRKYFHEVEGYNGRLDAMQAAMLHVKLSHLTNWNTQRRHRATEYNRLLAGNKSLILPFEPGWSKAVYHLYVIRTEQREGMMQHLKRAGIDTAIHYPVPLHMQNAYASLNYSPEDFPVATRVSREILSLPMFPQLTASQQSRVAQEVAAFTFSMTTAQLSIQRPVVASAVQVG